MNPPVSAALGVVGMLAFAGCGSRPDSRSASPVRVAARYGEVGISPGQFAYPRAIDFDGESFWVIDKAARVQRLSAAGESLSLWSMPEYENGKPTGVTAAPDAQIDPSGRPVLWIPDTHYHRIIAYQVPEDPRALPREVLRFGEYGQGPGQFIYPTDIALLHGPDGKTVTRIYIAEYGGNDRISIFEHDGPGRVKFIRSFGHFGLATSPGAVEFSRPQSIAIDAGRREIVITDACNHRVGRFTLDGELIAWIGSPESAGDGPGQFRYPYGLFLPGDGTALVSEFGNNRVQRLDLATGRSLGVYGRAGHGDGELATPWGLTMARDLIFVLDSGNNRLVGFEAPGVRLAGGSP
ncbi:MAG: hypothetical protein IT436_11885 [Phycisphaerales bacterium]|nr:hypothetical protein [Phycisphaerales bacterium]